jgi:hypothetical protein
MEKSVIKVALLGPAQMNDPLLRWTYLAVRKIKTYEWALLIPDLEGTSQMSALIADALDVEYTILTPHEHPKIISVTGNVEQIPTMNRLYTLLDCAQRADIVLILPQTKEAREIRDSARWLGKLAIDLS